MKHLMFALLLAAGSAAAQVPADPEARYHALIAELRCAVCQNQSIAESNAPLAADLREQVRAQIAAGRTDAEIVDFMTARYGDYVRYRPAFRPGTLILWLGPFVLLALAGFAATVVIRRSRAPVLPPAPDPGKLLDLLGDERRPGGRP